MWAKDKVAVVNGAVYVISGGGGNTGSIIANSLLSKGEKVRVLGRDAGRLQRFARKGAEAFTADVSDAVALTKAFSGVRAAYLMLPPLKPAPRWLRLFVDQNFGKQLMRVADAEI
jgi:uncharacterized protein YbjT (DUF2867 family)